MEELMKDTMAYKITYKSPEPDEEDSKNDPDDGGKGSESEGVG